MRLASPFSSEKATLNLLWGISLALLLYSIIRSIVVAITFDEAWSHLVMQGSWADIFWCRPANSNNHVGNTLLMKLSSGLLGMQPWALRLPNVLAHGLYLYWTLALARRLKQPVWVLFAFLFLNFQPYVLDFFSLARGYGLAMAMVAGALNQLLAYRERPVLRHLLWNALLAALAVFFNFAFLHFFLANAALAFLFVTAQAYATSSLWIAKLAFAGKHLLPSIVTTALLALYLRVPIKALVEAKEFYYGGTTGFWDDTVFTLGHALLYKVDYWKHDLWLLLKVVAFLLVGIGITALVTFVRRGFRFLDAPMVWFAVLLVVPALAMILQHEWMGSLFPIYRTALYLVPIFCLGVTYMLREWAGMKAGKVAAFFIAGCISIPLCLHNRHSLNLDHTAEWLVDADTPKALHDLETDFKTSGEDGPISIGCSWPLRSSINYYRTVWKWDWMLPVDAKGCQPGHRYYLVMGDGLECNLPDDRMPFGKDGGSRKIGTYPVSGVSLWRAEK